MNQAWSDTRFAGMINAFKYGAPPHGGIAPGIDRIVMLLAEETNIRDVIAFPMAQNRPRSPHERARACLREADARRAPVRAQARAEGVTFNCSGGL